MSETHDVKKEVKRYYIVFASLLALSVLTVAVSYVNFGVALGIAVALFIATLKSSLVASFFMHLAHEQKVIYNILILTVFFFISMMLLIISTYNNPLVGTVNLEEQHQPKVEATHHEESHGGGH